MQLDDDAETQARERNEQKSSSEIEFIEAGHVCISPIPVASGVDSSNYLVQVSQAHEPGFLIGGKQWEQRLLRDGELGRGFLASAAHRCESGFDLLRRAGSVIERCGEFRQRGADGIVVTGKPARTIGTSAKTSRSATAVPRTTSTARPSRTAKSAESAWISRAAKSATTITTHTISRPVKTVGAKTRSSSKPTSAAGTGRVRHYGQPCGDDGLQFGIDDPPFLVGRLNQGLDTR
jgi:hypothetical protein